MYCYPDGCKRPVAEQLRAGTRQDNRITGIPGTLNPGEQALIDVEMTLLPTITVAPDRFLEAGVFADRHDPLPEAERSILL